jgi:antirestriction protein
MTPQTVATPRVWIGCLAAYNAGDLHGQWVDATDIDELERVRAEVIRMSPAWKRGETAEEHAVMDYDGFGSLTSTLAEWPSFSTLASIAQAIEQHGPAFAAYVDACEPALDEHIASGFEDAYRGEWDSEQDYTEHEINEIGFAGVEIPDELMPYLNIDMIVRELFRHGDMSSRENPNGGIYVFDTAGLDAPSGSLAPVLARRRWRPAVGSAQSCSPGPHLPRRWHSRSRASSQREHHAESVAFPTDAIPACV